MKTQLAITKAGGIKKLASLFSLTTQAIYSWGEELPKLRDYQLRDMKPDWYKPAKKKTAEK